ncbi:MAG TPA: class I SAM-dependent methyltransferase [Capsulimonadaceae bacterium]|nr:class I SAM-dependent methyltransferase [Capsulimonadaceae bacterium]
MLMRKIDDQNYLRDEQYKDAANLKARMAIHDRFGVGAHPWHLWVFDHLLSLPQDARVLELGCGPGVLWAQNADRIPAGWAITLTDFSTGMLEEARAKLAPIERDFRFTQADAQQLPFDDESFDAVIANHMLYHVPDRPKAFAEIARVLRPGGRFFGATNGAGHMKELEDLMRAMSFEMPGAMVARTFSLENGAEQLRPFFTDIACSRLDDGLRVTETEPLVAYIASFTPAEELNAARTTNIRERIQAEIDAKGSFAITKDSGLFEARKA